MNDRRSRNLDTLLAAAAAPPLPEEEDAQALATVLTMFNTAGIAAQAGVAVTEPITQHSPIEPVALPGAGAGFRSKRMQLAVKCAVVFVLFLGTSIAIASTGILPSPVQSFVHHMFGGIGVPAPSPDTTSPSGGASSPPTSTTTVSTGPDAGASASASGLSGGLPTASGAAGSSASPGGTEASLYTLCTEVKGSGNSWKSTMSTADQDRLIAAAGGVNQVHPYCNQLLKSGASAAPSSGSTDAPSPSPSPTKTKGKGKGSGKSIERSGIGSAAPSPSPSPTGSARPQAR